MNATSIVSIDDAPGPFDQFPVDENVHVSQLGNDPAAFREHGERLATTFHLLERRECICWIFFGNELDDPFEVESRGLGPQDLEISHPS